MPKVTALVTVLDADLEVDLAKVGGGASGFDFPLHYFDLPGLAAGPVILFFRLKPTGRTRLDVSVNGNLLIQHTMNTTPARTFHEIVASTKLRENSNELRVSVSAIVGKKGSVLLSDFAMLYTVVV